MALFKRHTQKCLSLVSGLLLVLFVSMTLSESLMRSGEAEGRSGVVVELYKDAKTFSGEVDCGKELSGEETDWYAEALISFCFGHPCFILSGRHFSSPVPLPPCDIQAPPPKFPLI